jgi:DNA end-binding protein Ku
MRGHEVAPNQFVTFGQEELRRLRLETSTEMTIVRSVRLEEIDPVYFETSYYVRPDAGGERAYSLLFQAFRESRYVGLATVVMHGREHV